MTRMVIRPCGETNTSSTLAIGQRPPGLHQDCVAGHLPHLPYLPTFASFAAFPHLPLSAADRQQAQANPGAVPRGLQPLGSQGTQELQGQFQALREVWLSFHYVLLYLYKCFFLDLKSCPRPFKNIHGKLSTKILNAILGVFSEAIFQVAGSLSFLDHPALRPKKFALHALMYRKKTQETRKDSVTLWL